METASIFADTVSSRRWDDDEFLERRRAVLARWSTGEQLEDLAATVAHSRDLPAERRFPERLREARDQGVPLFQVGIGHTTLAEQREHMTKAVAEGVDLILTLTDTYTRKSSYERAEAGIAKALEGPETRVLNGFPIVNYGLQAREVFADAGVPVHISGNVDEEAMLSSEFGFAAGATCDFSHSLHDLVQHSRDYPIEKRIQVNQYISRLAGYYTERGAPIELIALANYQGLIPPGLGIAVATLSVLESAAQGVTRISLHRCIEGALVQDAAAFAAYRRVAHHYLERFGYHDVDCVTHSWPWMGAWPAPEYENAGLVAWCTSVALLAGVDWIYLKSVHEGSGIPSTESNLASIQMAKELRRVVPPQAVLTSPDIEEESHYIELEARALIDAAIEMGDGDPSPGQVAAVRHGRLDIPIAAWNGVADKVVTARDARGAVRYVDSGDLPLPEEVRRRHEIKMAERRKDSSLESDIALVVNDLRRYMTD